MFTEVLPLVEFVLEDGITDEEAIQILDLSIPKQKKEEKNWQESRMGSILLCYINNTTSDVLLSMMSNFHWVIGKS